MYGPRCVVVFLLVVPPSNWFWRGQVKIPGTVPFKATSLPLPCSVRDDTPSLRLPVLGRSASHPTPHLPSFGHPCDGAPIRTLFFAAVPLVRASPSGGSAMSSRSPSRGGVSPSRLASFCSGVSRMHSASPYAVGSNASGSAAAAFSAPPASLMPAVPSARAGIAPADVQRFDFSCVGIHDRACEHVSPRRSKSPGCRQCQHLNSHCTLGSHLIDCHLSTFVMAAPVNGKGPVLQQDDI